MKKLAPMVEEKLYWISRFNEYISSKGYSENTRKVYINSIKQFFRFYVNKSIDSLEISDIHHYNHEFIKKNKYSVSSQRQIISAIKLFYQLYQGGKIDIHSLEYSKKGKTLPKVISASEVRSIIRQIENRKHRVIVLLLYGTGVRISELLNLRVNDIDSHSHVIHVHEGKGKKDRSVQLDPVLLEELRSYYRQYRPKDYLIEGQQGSRYSRTSVNQLLKRYSERAGVKTKVTAHVLRHSYATHMLESGVNLRYIQELLGHKSSRTTEIYTHVSTSHITNLYNPLQDLDKRIKEPEINYYINNHIPPSNTGYTQ